MLYTFKSQVAAEVTMMKVTAEELLKIIGKPAEARGIITAAQAPAAIAALRAAIEQREAAAKAQKTNEAEDGEKSGDDDGDQYNKGISLRHRAVPFIELLELTSAAGKDVVWGV